MARAGKKTKTEKFEVGCERRKKNYPENSRRRPGPNLGCGEGWGGQRSYVFSAWSKTEAALSAQLDAGNQNHECRSPGKVSLNLRKKNFLKSEFAIQLLDLYTIS